MVWRFAAICCALAVGPIGAANAQAAPTDVTVIDLPLSGGDVQRVWYRQPEQPVAVLVMLAGSGGVLSIDSGGGIRNEGNFLVRTRAQWIERGFAVAITASSRRCAPAPPRRSGWSAPARAPTGRPMAAR
jgi:hypothetical protein